MGLPSVTRSSPTKSVQKQLVTVEQLQDNVAL